MNKQEPANGLLPLGAMAARIRVHPRELRREAERGGIPFIRIGDKGMLFDPLVVERALRQRQTVGVAEEVPNAG